MGPSDAQCTRGPAQLRQGVVPRGRQRAENAHARLQHQPGRGHPGGQRQLGVPVLDRQRRAELERPVVIGGDHLLLGYRQAHPAPGRFQVESELPELPKQLQLLATGARVQRRLRRHVAELGATTDQAARDPRGRGLPGRVELQFPDQRGSHLIGQQARRAVGEGRRVQRGLAGGRVQRLAALVRLRVETATGGDERCHVRDRVLQPVPGTGAGEVERLVEVGRTLRVEGDELDVGAVGDRQHRGLRRVLGFGQNLRREAPRHPEGRPQAAQPFAQDGWLALPQREVATGHCSSSAKGAGVPVEAGRTAPRHPRSGHQGSTDEVRTRTRSHSSQRSTSSGAAAVYAVRALEVASSWHPPHRRPLSSAAPTPPARSRIRS